MKPYNASFKGPSAKDVPDCNLAMETLESGPSSVVAGCVNVITGDFFESYTPMTIPGAQPLAVQCFYCSSEKAWNFLHMPELAVGKSSGENHLYAQYFGDNGSGMTYRTYFSKSGIKGRNLIIPSILFEKGLTNCGSGIISGQTNWKNSSVSMIRRHDEKAYMLTYGSGINRIFSGNGGTHLKFKGARLGKYLLESENYPNGNRLLYRYDEGQLDHVRAVNFENKTLARISLFRDRDLNLTHWISDSGEHVAFLNEYRIKKIASSHAACVSYSYNNQGLLEKKEMPEDRFLKISYFISGKAKGRVASLKTAVGLSYAFVYKVDLGETSVYDAKLNLTKYYYDKKTKRLQNIKRYEKAECFLSQENYFWHDSKEYNGNLKAKTFEGDGKNYFWRYLDYDDFGNVTEDRLFGNLTGKFLEPLLFRDGYIPTTPCEMYLKAYHHTQDERNLLLVENDGKKLVCCDYHSNRLLKTRLTTNTEGKILKREFFEYDGNGVLTQAFWDDGQALNKDDLSYVTERHLKIIYPRTMHPIGLPQVVEEYYMDMASGQYHLLKKVVNDHSPQGKIRQEDHYGNDGNFAYSLKWEYDNLGNVKKKSDALDQTITFTYDGNSNKLSENGPRSDWRKEFQYDLNNCLIGEIEYWAGGTVLKTTHKYNSIKQKVATTDPFGQVTTFEYNALGHLLKLQYPPLFNGPESTITPIEETTYDAMGNAIVQKDRNGHITKTSYTIRGQPYRIEHPDGSIEQKEYSLSGLLVKEIARNGIVTTYTYDSFDRIIETQITDLEGIQKTKTSTYSTFNLLSETDEEGMVTFYEYDGAGRLILIRKGDHLTQYQYDSLSRVIKTIESIDVSNVCITCKEYDLLDRVIEERIEDAHSEVFKKEQYSYDVDGKKTSTTLFTQAGIAKTETEYHPDGKPYRITDALGNQTLYFYDHAYSFKGQTVLKMTKIDPLGNQEFKIYDTHGNVCCQVKIDPFGSLLQNESNYYDALGQKIHSQITVYQGQEQKRIIETLWEYDTMGNLVLCIEALGTPDQKTVHHHYNQFGQKEKTEMPNGISILNTYDSLGRLSSYKSTDNTVHYQYSYDKKDRPLLVKDLIHNIATEFTYDEYGRLTSERLGNGLTLSYTYDQLDRPVTVTLPDQSSIHYHYNAQHLIAVERVQEDAVSYTHCYNYDLAGNVTKEILLGQAGNINYQYDLLERPISLHAPHWQSIIPQAGFDAIGNLLERKVTDRKGSVSYNYAYDNLNQLISENGFVSHTYQHDSVYNRTAKNHQPYTVNALNQLLSQTNIIYCYDGNGNLIEKIAGTDQIQYVYDALDRLIEVHDGSDITTYTYDSFHRRLSKTREELTTHYLYQNKNEIGAFNQGEMTQLRVLGISYGAEIGGAVALELDGKIYAPIHDSHGNVVVLLDSSGNFVEGYRYTAFGESQIFSEKTVNNPWRYSSKRLDAETGFLFFGRRHYSPEIGRWTTSDPAGHADGPNLYAYVHNHPTAYIDPDGRFAFRIQICAHNPQQLQANASAFASNSYVLGMMQATGGLTEVCVGSGIIMGSGGIGCVPGAIVTAHGLDNYIAGMNALMTGKPTETVTSQLLQSTGLSPKTADLIDSSLSMVGTVAGTAILRAKAPAISNSIKLPQTSLIGSEGINTVTKSELEALSVARQSYLQKQLINTHLYQLEQYGAQGFKQLQNKRIKYYGEFKAAKDSGEMAGARVVREWNPNTGLKKTWVETLDGNNNVRVVRPQRSDCIKKHFMFDQNGNFTSSW